MALEPGQQVTWRYTPRYGYAFMMAVKATVVKVGPKRVTIDAHMQSGRKVRKVVRPENVIALAGNAQPGTAQQPTGME